MIFLIHYNRKKGKIIQLREFRDTERNEAEAKRFDIEIQLNRESIADHEVVLFEAKNLDDLHKTHMRYFSNHKQIATEIISYVTVLAQC